MADLLITIAYLFFLCSKLKFDKIFVLWWIVYTLALLPKYNANLQQRCTIDWEI